jgi:hypothetical protein
VRLAITAIKVGLLITRLRHPALSEHEANGAARVSPPSLFMSFYTDSHVRISVGAMRAFRAVVPEPHRRIPIDWASAPILLASFLPFVFMAYLARRPDTYHLRLLLLPTVIVANMSTGFRYMFTIPGKPSLVA